MIKMVIPMGGEGKRFIEKGYTFPKPLVEIKDKPMIEWVIDNLTPSEKHQFIFLCKQEHLQKYALKDVLELISPNGVVISMRGPTAGALCSVLLAMEHLKGEDELLVANADQVIDIHIDDFLSAARKENWDGFIITFPSTHPKWSYVKLEENQVVAVAEKRPISRNATAGLYYFRKGNDFLEAAEKMLLKNSSIEGQFYVAPIYNELILMGKRIGTFDVTRDQMHSLGTPEDVDNFVSYLSNKAPNIIS